MKRISLLLPALMLLTVLLCPSCKEEDNPVLDLPPTISFISGSDYISNDTVLNLSSEFVVKILAQANESSGSSIQSLIITRIFNNQIQDVNTLSYDQTVLTYEAGFVARSETGAEKIEFKVIDKAGQSAMIDLQITTKVVTPPPPANPTISFVAGSGLISDDATLTVNTPFAIKVFAEANATSGAELESIKISRIFGLNYWDTTLIIHESTIALQANFIAQATPGTEKIEFKVTDEDGQSDTIDLQITTEPDISPINIFTMRILGSYQSTIGCSLASINGNVYTLAEAFANQSVIDFFYWWGASSNATIGAPDDDKTNEVYTGTYGLQNWTTKNSTRFISTTLTVAEFDAITDGNTLAANASGATLSRISNLAPENVLGFMTVTGKYGLIKVTSINPGAAGDITIDVKIQQ